MLVELQQALQHAASAEREENSEENSGENADESSAEVVVVRVALPSAAEREQVRATRGTWLFPYSHVINRLLTCLNVATLSVGIVVCAMETCELLATPLNYCCNLSVCTRYLLNAFFWCCCLLILWNKHMILGIFWPFYPIFRRTSKHAR